MATRLYKLFDSMWRETEHVPNFDTTELDAFVEEKWRTVASEMDAIAATSGSMNDFKEGEGIAVIGSMIGECGLFMDDDQASINAVNKFKNPQGDGFVFPIDQLRTNHRLRRFVHYLKISELLESKFRAHTNVRVTASPNIRARVIQHYQKKLMQASAAVRTAEAQLSSASKQDETLVEVDRAQVQLNLESAKKLRDSYWF